MDSQITIKATLRKLVGKQVEKLRRDRKIPAVLYGHQVKNIQLAVDKKEFEEVFGKSGENTLIKLTIDSEEPRTVLVHDVQHHFLTGDFIHIDFYEVNMTEKIKAKVPLVFVGETKAVKDLGGVLVKNVTEVEVESLPGDLPHMFEVELSKLNTFEDAIYVSELKVDPQKVKILAKAEEVIAKVIPPRTEEELKALEEKPVVEEVTAVEGVVKEAPAKEPEGQEPNESQQKG